MKNKNAFIIALIATLVTVYAVSATGFPPPANPPSNNVSAPINVGTGTQSKAGALGVAGVFQSNSATYLATASGNVGIGTTAPGAKLEVFGSGPGLYLNQASAADLYIRYHVPGIRWWTVGPKANGDFWFSNTSDHSGSVPFMITSGGNIAQTVSSYNDGWGQWQRIGTPPGSAFGFGHVDGRYGYLTQWDSDYAFFGLNNVSSDRKDVVIDWEQSSDDLQFRVAGSPLVTIKGDGKVGIGTTSPAHKLVVVGRIHTTTGFAVATKNDAGAIASGSGFFETTAPVNYYSGASSWQHLIESRHSNDANNYALQIAGSFFDQNLYFRKTNNSSTTAWNRFIYENSNGYVGIGLTNPSYRLQVNGSIAATTYFHSSDRALKKNIVSLEKPLDKVMRMEGVSFEWKDSGEKSIGLIAQEIEEILPELVVGQEGSKSINYNALIAVLIEAIKDQQKQIDELKNN